MSERLPIPTPFQVGPVNAYVAGRTVVDPGPDSEDALEALAAGLADFDLTFADLERVLVTHPHPDHFGLANHLRSHGADVVASPAGAAILRDFEGRLDYEQAYFTELFEAHGMDSGTVQTVTQLPEAFVEYAPSVAVDREVSGGDAVAINGAEFTVRELEGHSEGELGFEWHVDSPAADGDGEFLAIVGDQVLGDTTPNPFLQPPPRAGSAAEVPAHDGPIELDDLRPRRLLAFNESLAGLRDAGYDRLLPGHGEPIEDPAGRIDEILASHEERTAAVAEIVDGETTAVDVMHGLFPDLAVVDYFPGISEAIGHLDVLVERGDLVRVDRDGELVYRPV